MASIPNLNTLRTGRRGTRLRGRRGGPGTSATDDGSITSDEQAEQARDKIIQQTDGDASSSRMSAVTLGYLDDPFARQLYQLGDELPRRYPIINRGTYVRTKAIDRLVTRFLEANPAQQKQIISLGAGSDTRFFRLCAGKHNVVYHELDFEDNVNPKRTSIRNANELARMTVSQDQGSAYHLHAIDLRVLTNKSPPILPDLDPDLPTLILSECCLCYFPPDLAISVLNYFTMHIKGGCGIVLYEPVRPFDAFGRTMMSNLASRGIELRTLKKYYSLDAQRRRLKLAGFESGQGARDVHQIWNSNDWVDEAERHRIEKIEWLDEVEEWNLLASHYCVSWGWRGDHLATAWSSISGERTDTERLDDDMM
ncbi:Putative methyltransferase Ppm1/Ppm2/Tcmp, S-adenosyl-L-methionine-dependent methyltransferase [Septoria linicola]|uniref:Leucine carboxyl methyltransferase 1 n=1 Tax=Septoria linicola TaxID=215465 RepID=A0A9Q9EN45_9PEZI|nr:Putative methyltransferase Ppm1/Ppm2/Tcmp, S-adenosyl-L-methionine-dependent methyltransferase [Septoria linicola]